MYGTFRPDLRAASPSFSPVCALYACFCMSIHVHMARWARPRQVGACVCLLCACSSVILHVHMFALRASSRLFVCLFVCLCARTFVHSHMCASRMYVYIYVCMCVWRTHARCKLSTCMHACRKCICFAKMYTYVHVYVHTRQCTYTFSSDV